MERVPLGETGLMVSRVGFGGIPIQQLDKADAVAVVNRCLDLDINFFDTANAYTTSEGVIGKAIGGRRDGLVLATKSTSRRPERIIHHIDLSLERLGVDRIDLYQLHGIDDAETYQQATGPGGVLSAVRRAREEGKVGHVGITSHSLDVSRVAAASGLFETLQFPLNFVDKEAVADLLPLCRRNGVGFIAMKPMGGGRLESATLALKYLLQFPGVVPVVGVNAAWQVEAMAAAASGDLSISAKEERRMAEIAAGLDKEYCRHCNYCQPCPQEIMISTALDFPTFVKRFPAEFCFSGWVADAMARVDDCTDCGECEDRCPFHLPIRQLLRDNAAHFRRLKASAC